VETVRDPLAERHKKTGRPEGKPAGLETN